MIKRAYFLIVILLILLGACVDVPNDFVAPRFDVSINIPVANRHLTIDEIIDNDTSYVKWYTEGSSKNLLYATDTININKTTVGNKLKNDSFASFTSKKIGEIKLSKFDDVNVELNTEDIIGVQEGSLVLSPRDVSVQKDFNSSSQFQSLDFSDNSGNIITLILNNNMPIDMLVKTLLIKNKSDNSIVAELTSQIQLAPGQSYSENVSVAGVHMENGLYLEADLYTPGTNGESVEFQSSDNLRIDVEFPGNLYVETATAEVPVQDPITHFASIEVDDSTEINQAVIYSGSFNFNIDNKLPVNLTGEIIISSLITDSGNEYLHSFTINAGESYLITENNLSGWKIVGSDGKINYQIEFVNEPSSGLVELNMNDSLRADYSFGDIIFSSFTGKLKPTKFTLNEISSDIDLHDLKSKLNYESINFEKLYLDLNLLTSANLDFDINGMISVGYKSSNTFYSQNLNIEVPGQNIIDIADLFNQTSGTLPDVVKISGTATANPDYENVVSIENTDSISGKAFLEVPLNLSLDNINFNDTIDVEMDSFEEDEAEKIKEFTVTINISNNIAIGGTFTGAVYDINFNKLIDIPTNSFDSNPEYFEIPIPQIDQDGNVTAPGILTQTFKINSDDAVAFSKGNKMIINLTLNTAESQNQNPVKIKITDFIDIKVFASGKLEVSE